MVIVDLAHIICFSHPCPVKGPCSLEHYFAVWHHSSEETGCLKV